MVELIAYIIRRLYWDAYKYGTPRTLRGRGWCGAVANDRVLGSRVGWARAYVAEELGMAAWEPEEKDLSRLWSRYSLLVASYQVWMECSQGILYVRGAEDKCAIFSE